MTDKTLEKLLNNLTVACKQHGRITTPIRYNGKEFFCPSCALIEAYEKGAKDEREKICAESSWQGILDAKKEAFEKDKQAGRDEVEKECAAKHGRFASLMKYEYEITSLKEKIAALEERLKTERQSGRDEILCPVTKFTKEQEKEMQGFDIGYKRGCIDTREELNQEITNLEKDKAKLELGFPCAECEYTNKKKLMDENKSLKETAGPDVQEMGIKRLETVQEMEIKQLEKENARLREKDVKTRTELNDTKNKLLDARNEIKAFKLIEKEKRKENARLREEVKAMDKLLAICKIDEKRVLEARK